MSLFGTSGIRAIADKNLISLAFKVGLATGRLYQDTVIGRDTRTSGDVLKHAFISGLLASGARCTDIGIAPTPTVGLAAGKHDAGVMITASHNPPEYNGMKMINPDGSAFDAGQQAQIEEAVAAELPDFAPWREYGRCLTDDSAIAEHLAQITGLFPDKIKLKVVVDCGGGAASVITPELLARMGCEVIPLYCQPDGRFPRGSEPVAANLEELMEKTAEVSADIGIAHDGDADRLMAVDDRGRLIPGDKLLVIFARALGTEEVVTTVDASMAIEDMGFRTRRTPVGDTYVSEELKRGGVFGGEPSGSWVFPRISLCPDGIYAAAQIVNIASRQKLSELADSLPEYPLLRGSASSEGVNMAGLTDRLMSMEPLTTANTDGLRLGFEDGWLLVRPSGTEPKIRITAEARDAARARQLYDTCCQAIKDCRGEREVIA